ncbi:hypothetical protein P8452_48361 [Trifolium repens]|nr:hypothetical protein P8452_48361 [Trifolium repens]
MNNQLDEQLEESLLIKVKDTCSGEIIIQKLVAKENIKAQWKNIEDRFEFDYAAGIKWMKKVSEQNTRNRKKLKVIHAGGSKSNARRGREMELQLDRPICRGEVYLSTLRKKSGNYVNDEGKAMADKILKDPEKNISSFVSSDQPEGRRVEISYDYNNTFTSNSDKNTSRPPFFNGDAIFIRGSSPDS